jgi:hypothetical protein
MHVTLCRPFWAYLRGPTLQQQIKFQINYIQQQHISLKEKKEAQKQNKLQQQIDMLKLGLQLNAHNPAKMAQYWNQLEYLMLGVDPDLPLGQSFQIDSDDDYSSNNSHTS